jgi:hypothetical protein
LKQVWLQDSNEVIPVTVAVAVAVVYKAVADIQYKLLNTIIVLVTTVL